MPVKSHHHGRSVHRVRLLHSAPDQRLMAEMEPVEGPRSENNRPLERGEFLNGFENNHRLSFIARRRKGAENFLRFLDD